MITIEMMADYQCFPLWWGSGDAAGDIDPRALPISPELAGELMEWAICFTATLNLDDPYESGFDSTEEAESFKQWGATLWHRLQKELHGQYHVVYRPFGTIYASDGSDDLEP